MRKLSVLCAFLSIIPFCYGACPDFAFDIEGRCFYFFYNTELSYMDARQVCQNNQGDLAILDDCNIHKQVVDHIVQNVSLSDAGWWIGASELLAGNKFLWVDGSTVSPGAPSWGRLPANNGTQEPTAFKDCVYLAGYDGYNLHTELCSVNHSPLCETAWNGNGTCPEPYIEVNQRCFQISAGLSHDQESAVLTCQMSNGELARIDDCAVLSDVAEAIIANFGYDAGFWIGATRDLVSFEFEWPNGDILPTDSDLWGVSGQRDQQVLPDNMNNNEQCLELWRDGSFRFNDVDCSSLRHSLCETTLRVSSPCLFRNGTEAEVGTEIERFPCSRTYDREVCTTDGWKPLTPPTQEIMACDPPFVATTYGCLYDASAQYSMWWSECRGLCFDYGADLASPDTHEDFLQLTADLTASVSTSYNFWAGIYRESGYDVSGWKWISNNRNTTCDQEFYACDNYSGDLAGYFRGSYNFELGDIGCTSNYYCLCEKRF